MGRDLTLYPKTASRDSLKAYLEGLGFTRCDHLWDWPAGTLNYLWFDHQEYRSIDGVSADIYPTAERTDEFSECGWALHVRNLYCASWHDVKMLNDVLRGARKNFGGTIHGDYGTNRYAPLWEDRSTPISRGVAAVYGHVLQDLRAVRAALPEPVPTRPRVDLDRKMKSFFEYMEGLDPARVIYNGLVPFAVAMFEYFFSRVFRVLISYDPTALKKRTEHTGKVDFSALLELDEGTRSVADIIADDYTFQNLDQLNKAYKKWLEIDVRKEFFKKKRIGRSVAFLENRLSQIIQYRHGVVHHFELDRSLTKEGYLEILEAVETSIEVFVTFLEKKYSVTISRD